MAECLYQAIEERSLSLPVLQGVRTRTVTFRLEPFLLIGATTEEYDLPRLLRSRFGIIERLDHYKPEDLRDMAAAEGNRLGIEVTLDAARALGWGARGTPRLLLGHLGSARDLASLDGGVITEGIAREALIVRTCRGRVVTESGRRALRGEAPENRSSSSKTAIEP